MSMDYLTFKYKFTEKHKWRCHQDDMETVATVIFHLFRSNRILWWPTLQSNLGKSKFNNTQFVTFTRKHKYGHIQHMWTLMAD